MMQKVKSNISEFRETLSEISSANANMRSVLGELESVELKYQRGELEYREFTQICNRILSNRSKEQVMDAYRNYIRSLYAKLKALNSKILMLITSDKSYETLILGKMPYVKGGRALPSLENLDISEIAEVSIELPAKPEFFEIKKPVAVEAKKPIVKVEADDGIKPPYPKTLEPMNVPKPVKLGFLKRLIYAFQAKEKPWLDRYEQEGVLFGGIFSQEFLKYLLTGEQKNPELFGQTRVLPSILSYEDQSRVDRELSISKTDILDPYLLEKQIKELKSLINKKKPEVYQANSLGYIANITVRKISIYFIEHYPDFFRNLYKNIRLSNIRILANTYINIIFFLTIVISLGSIPIFSLIFGLQENTPVSFILKTSVGVLVIGICTFAMGAYYPVMKAKNRRRSINTNLPFAIDHMASVIASGVSPATMFKLISTSREYGEISIEMEKISNYVEFFGYDILTAIKAVSLTTPSEEFKEFLDGFVSTIETGGDLKQYLSQKSAEALLSYRLERQKYVESLSTYSDIYTGVLIAAPMFFVTALSLVSMLGGNIGGMSVTSIIALGTYLVIPGLNILFIAFLELNQPEI